MKILRRAGFVTALLTALSACSGGDVQSTSLLTEAGLAARTAFKARGEPKGVAVPGAVPQGLSRASIAAETRPMVLVNIDSLSSAGTLLKTGENNGYVTWVSQDRLTLTSRDGVVSATRGLVNDLTSADVAPTLAALRTGSGSSYSKVLRHIGDDRQIEQMRLTCQMAALGAENVVILERSHPSRRFAETCTDAEGAQHRNEYWLGSDGTMWRSRQFVHPVTGYVEVRRLIR